MTDREEERESLLVQTMMHGKGDSAEDDVPGKPASAADGVRARRVEFPRDSLIRQISSNVMYKPPSLATEPGKATLKSFNRGSLMVEKNELQRITPDDHGEYDQSKEMRGKFLVEFGLSKVMVQRIMSKCSATYQVTALLDNGTRMKRDDSKFIEGKRKKEYTMDSPDDKSPASNEDYNLRLAPCLRLEALKDLSFFLIHLAANMALPTTFELFSTPNKIGGKGRGFRRVGSTPKSADKKSSAEDYIPIGEQAESASEMIENFLSSIVLSSECSEGPLHLIEEVKEFYDDEHLEIQKQGGNILVIIMTSFYPWGSKSDEQKNGREKFVKLLNEFADLPVTFVFFVEGTIQDVIEFYDNLIFPQSGIKADINIAKGLGIMIDGVQKHNPWLNYCLPIHLCQALGICSNILSQAEYRPLLAEEVGVLCNTFIGDIPDPDDDINACLRSIENYMSIDENTKWNPATGGYAPLIDTVKLKAHLSKQNTCLSCCRRCLKF
mmetsp:Transcript_30791/g.65494  ORF Transcript_30791/g.65494 Transcript_30791/m.65494 type:complete len:495 (+) Transcript_30791:159-1643(+)